ncbi:MAG TPA: Swt1 family HEPN domain-containing protein [Streptosporangiaceae bacterium]|nr:Swt1 family HEPN domain-containing protein [Streptosporangiaceae bacterium]
MGLARATAMATSNRDRIGQGFDLLAAGLGPFVDARMAAIVPGGQDWVAMLQARNAAKYGRDQKLSKSDPRFLLRVVTEEWRTFRDQLSRAEQGFASELWDTGNRWAHGEAFSADDTQRALDTMERMLSAADAAEQAAAVRRLRLEAQRAVLEAETRRAVRSTAGVEGMGLKPWREVIQPHSDVASDNFNASEFAADLYFVSLGEGSREYTDPVEFFNRTYLTGGLKDLLLRAARRIGGDMNASPVVNLQTNFGGGKTHSMLALWHLLSGRELGEFPQELQELLAGHPVGELGRSAARVALVGNHVAAGKGSVKPDGTHVRTLWGELAWQLGAAKGGATGARESFQLMADADATRSNPGAALHDLIVLHAPCLILIDEWVAYARQLYGRDDLDGGTFDTQFTFAQTLTEVVKQVQGAMLVVSIPASSEDPSAEERERAGSDLEVGGLNGREALARLQQVIRRTADQWRPATSLESFEIVRRRLFEDSDAAGQADIAVIARTFTDFYARHKGEFPSAVAGAAYESRIKAAYPIHPELFDRLYEDWSTLARFQRTRGVLRLMSAVIYSLWKAGDAAPLILPGGVPLDSERVRSELTQYLEDDFKPVIDADIDGDGSTPEAIDQSRPTLGQRKVTRRIARAIFLGSAATLKAAHKGIERPSVWLGVAVPGDTVGNFGSALSLLTDRTTYLYGDGDRYWYDVQASVARIARDYADRLRERPDDVYAEITRRLSEHETSSRARGEFARVQVGSEDTADIPDEPVVRLVIVHPRWCHSRGDESSGAMFFCRRALDTRGSSQRVNRNMVVMLAADAKRMEDLQEAVRDYLAWQSIAGAEERIVELALSAQQASQARKRFKDADRTVWLRIADTYHWVIVPIQPEPDRPVVWDVVRADSSKDRLAERASDKLVHLDLLRIIQGARTIRYDLDHELSSVWQRGHIEIGELWNYYCRHPYLPRLRDRAVLDAGIYGVANELTWEIEAFAVASGYDQREERYLGLVLPDQDPLGQVTDRTLLVRPDLAVAQREQETAEREAASGGSAATGGSAGQDGASSGVGTQPVQPAGDPGSVPPPAAGPRNTRFFGVAQINPERYARELTRLSQEIIQQLAAADGVELEIRVEIAARKPDGYSDDKVRNVTENARTLKFETYGFEDR